MFPPMTPMSERTYTQHENARLNTYRPVRRRRSLLELLKALRPKIKNSPQPETINISVQG
jgi:uncharacterized protein (UPF0216 family)